MQRSFMIGIYSLILSLFTTATTVSQTITLIEPLVLREGRDESNKNSIIARKGAEIIVIDVDQNWVQLKYKGKKYFTEFQNIYRSPAKTDNNDTSASLDSTCDFGAPYSGSNIFFDRPFAKFRHIYPNGLIFGEHQRFPC